jgi:hypothetical protein
MQNLLIRYAFGFLIGIILGKFYPLLASLWGLLVLLGVIVANESIGKWGLGSHWNQYRLFSYALYTGAAGCVWIGIQLGSGNVGIFLIILGKMLS